MNKQEFSISLMTTASPEEAFKVLLDVRSWWTGLYNEFIEGKTDSINEEFTFRAGGGVHYSKHRLIEAIPCKKIVWQIVDGELSFVKHKKEWIGTRMRFDIRPQGHGSEITFTHEGLTPELECYDSCSTTWTRYLSERLQARLKSARNITTN